MRNKLKIILNYIINNDINYMQLLVFKKKISFVKITFKRLIK